MVVSSMRNNGALRITKRKFLVILATVSMFGLLLRLIGSAELLGSHPSVSNPSDSTDMYTYQKFSKEILNGTYDFSKGFYYQPFYYTVFLPLVYAIGGHNPWGVIVGQSLLGLGTIWFIGLAFARVFGKTTGLIAAVLVALNRYLIFYTPFTLLATLQTFWISFLFWSAILAFQMKKHWMWFAVGGVTGLAIITRGNAVLLIPVVVVVMLCPYRRSLKQMSWAVLIYAVGALLPQLPYSIVNYRAHHQWIGASSAGNAVLALGNTPESPPGGREEYYGPGPMEYTESYHAWTSHARAQCEESVSVVTQILRWTREEPFAYLELKFRTLLLFWNQAEVPNNLSLYAFLHTTDSSLLGTPLLFDFWMIGCLGLAGMLISLLRHKKNPKVVFGVAYVGMYCVSIVVFYMLSRFRLPILPILCGFSGYTFSSLTRSIRRYFTLGKEGRSLLIKLIICLTTYIIVGYGFDMYRVFLERHVVRLAQPNGVQLMFDKKSIIKDHGPITFGGWVTQPMQGLSRVTKEFVIPRSFEMGATASIRFPVLSPEPTTFWLTTKVADDNRLQNEARITVAPGVQWVEHEINCAHRKDHEKIVKLDCIFKTESDNVNLYFDSQRFYARTTVDGRVNDELGEMVIDLVIEDGK